MKKLLFAAAAAAIISSVFVSCSSEDPAEALTVNTERTATFIGKILIRDNESSLVTIPATWEAPEALQITATVKYSDLGFTISQGEYIIPASDISYSASTGEFKVVSPVAINGSVIRIRVAAFKGKITKTFTVNGMYADKAVNVIWNAITINSGLAMPGEDFYLSTQKLSGGNYIEVVNAGDNI